MENDQEIKVCFFCKSEIHLDAIKCNHCFSHLENMTPAHGGICPLCKSTIDKDALKCKYCQSWVIHDNSIDFPSSEKSFRPIFRSWSEGGTVWEDADKGYWGGVPKPNPFLETPPQSWRCRTITDWSTFDPAGKLVLERYECIEIHSGARKVMGGGYRKVSQRELDQWMHDNA